MEWKEVRRRRAAEKVDRVITTFFVTNVPKEATKKEISDAFIGFGRLTDVFMGLRKGKNGKYYVFIRFTDVKNVKEMEKRLDGTMVRGRKLEVNLALHKRKEPPTMAKNNPTGRKNNTFTMKNSLHGVWWRSRDHRTFVEVVDQRKNIHTSPPTPLSISPHIVLHRDA